MAGLGGELAHLKPQKAVFRWEASHGDTPTPTKRVLSGASSTTKSEPQRGPRDLLIDDGKSWKNT